MAKLIDLDGLKYFKGQENAMVASDYVATKTYAVGEYAYYNGTLYRCKTAITTAEAWTSGHWTAAKLADDCSGLMTAFNSDINLLSRTNIAEWTKGNINSANGADVNTTGAKNSYAKTSKAELIGDTIIIAPDKIILAGQTDPLWRFRIYFWSGSTYLGANTEGTAPVNVKEYAQANFPNATSYRIVVHLNGGTSTYFNQIPKGILTIDAPEKSPYTRYSIKEYGTSIQGFTHSGFPRTALFHDKEVIAFRLAKAHATPSDSANWGVLCLAIRDINGKWENFKIINVSSITGISGEINGPQLTVSKDGNYIFLATFTTNNTGTTTRQNIILQLDSDLNVYKTYIENNVSYYFWGNTLTTPSGKLLQAAYTSGTIKIYRSTTAFNGDVSALTFEEVQSFTAPTGSEPCLGYFNNALVCVIRRNDYNWRFTQTDNLEGDSGWATIYTPQHTSSDTQDVIIHDPYILPYWKGEVLPFCGAHKYTGQYTRFPVIGFLEFDAENNKFKLCAMESVDKEIEAQQHFSGYCGITYYGGGIFGMPYYREWDTDNDFSTLGAQSAMYYKQINLYAMCPQLSHYSLT